MNTKNEKKSDMALIQELSPRAYQIEMFEKAVNENTIIYLPTGSGKTFIAVKLTIKLSSSIQSVYSKGGKRTIFVVNTIPLVTQQSEYLSRHTGLNAKGFSGDLQVDYWSKSKWLTEIEDTPILVMTAQIFVDILNHGIMSLDRVNLIVFDECHRAVSDHPMRQIMQRFEACPEDDRPRVLGLSATLLNSNVKCTKLEQTIYSLEVTFQAKIASIKSLSVVAGFSTNPRESFVLYTPQEKTSVMEKMDQIINEVKGLLEIVKIPQPSDSNMSSKIFKPKSKNDKLSNILSDILENVELTGVFGGNKAILLHMIQLESIKKIVNEQQTMFVLEYVITKMMLLRKLFDKTMDGLSIKQQIYSFSSDKVMKLIAILKKFNDEKDPDQKFCCIIFVKRRFTAQVLYHILKSLNQADEQYNFIVPEFMVGNNNDPFKSVREAQCIAKWNKNVLQRFRNGKSNCIVATDVVDEGVDIPHCTLIVRFDLPLDFRAYIQSKGRARHSSSQYIMLKAIGDSKYRSTYYDFQSTEKLLQEYLVGKSDLRTTPDTKDIEDELYQYTIEPFRHVNREGKPCVITEQSAISLLNRYCANLYKSKFISLSPTWILHKRGNEKENANFQVSLELPIVSPVKETIWGDHMTSTDDAKRSVAMKTCIKLKQANELDDNLNPIDPNLIQENLDILFPNWINEESSENFAPGTYSVKRKHNLVHPGPVYAAFPQENTVLYLHILEMKPTYSVPHDNRLLIFYNLLKSNSGFGILTTKRFPNIPSFPIFMNVGSLEVNIKVNHCKLRLDSEELKAIKGFHSMIFIEILNTIKDFMVFDNKNLENSFAVVPVDDKWNINWEIVNKYQSIEKKLPPPPFEINEADYELNLVTPTYRGSQSIYIVTMICDDITAESSFPTLNFHSYVHYYKERHSVNIENKKQYLLEVKSISTKVNCIRPRSSKSNISKRRRTNLNDELVEHLVPELCNRIDFPALYWLKATTLHSVLHRLTQLLIAEDLRQEIMKDAGIKTQLTPTSWSPLIIPDLEIEEKKGQSADTTLDESMELDVSELQPEICGPEIDVLNLETEYSWPKEEEPVDLIREADRIQLIDIEYYHKFMGQSSQNKVAEAEMGKPKQGVVYRSRPNMIVPTIDMLTRKDFEGLNPVILMKALTSKMSADCFDLERMETLGDSFLKFAISLFLYETFKNYNEGQLTALKGKFIGNRNLYYCGVKKNIPGRMKIEEFSPMSNFITPAYTAERDIQHVLIENEISPNVLYELHIPLEERISGVISNTTLDEIQEKVLAWNDTPSHTGMEHFLGKQTVPDKVVADSVEAIIGACLCSLGADDTLNILKWFGIIPKESGIEMKCKPVSSNSLSITDSARVNSHMPWADMIENKLNYKFNDRSLLLQAFSHPSYSANGITPCYQRLEFLGDAVLDFLITVYIYEHCGQLSPGDLTDLRSALVNNITFACVAVRYGLHTALLSYVPLLHDAINRFVKFQEERKHAVDVELLWILLEEEECNMAEHVDVPKALGDIFESFIGAIYIDSGKNLLKVWEIVFTMMHKEFELFCSDVPKQPVRVIYETQGARPRFLKSTRMEGTDQVMIPLEVTVHGKQKLFHGFGANKKQAKSAASKQALKFIRVNK